MTKLPVGEECWIDTAEPIKPVSCPPGLPTQPLELAARPADDIEIDPLQGGTQLRLVEVAVVVDPAANARVVHLGRVLQGLVAAMMKRPAPNCSADGRQRLRPGGRQEARKGPTSPSQRFSRPECKPEKVQRLVRKVATAVRIFLKASHSGTPEDQLMLQFQGMIAEYELAQILERSRRGKRHRAKAGEVSVLGGAPYGYR